MRKTNSGFNNGFFDGLYAKITGEAAPDIGVQTEKRLIVRSGIDTGLLFAVVALICFGGVMSFSAGAVYASETYGDSTYFLVRYVAFAAIAVLVSVPFVVFARPRFWRLFGFVLYFASIALLLLVLVAGTSGGGAKRWLSLGPVTIQPSEIAKTAVVMALALYMSKYGGKAGSCEKKPGFMYGVVFPCAVFGIICLLVALEKHISGLMIIGLTGISVIWLGGTKNKHILMIFGLIATAGLFLVAVSGYAQKRVSTWLFLEKADPYGEAWQTWQGLFAIGSGGLFGRGLGKSVQKFGYVAAPQNDFVFTIICEELGFFGALAVVSIFAYAVYRCFKIGSRAPDKFTSLVAYGLGFKMALQVILNIAVVTNSMPNTGISLPFFSSGGTSLAMQIFETAIVLSVSRYTSRPAEETGSRPQGDQKK